MLINFVVNVVYTINYIFNCLIHSCIKFLSDIVNGISYICNYLDMVIDSCEKFLSNIINHQYNAYAIENSINNLQNAGLINENLKDVEDEKLLSFGELDWNTLYFMFLVHMEVFFLGCLLAGLSTPVFAEPTIVVSAFDVVSAVDVQEMLTLIASQENQMIVLTGGNNV